MNRKPEPERQERAKLLLRRAFAVPSAMAFEDLLQAIDEADAKPRR